MTSSENEIRKALAVESKNEIPIEFLVVDDCDDEGKRLISEEVDASQPQEYSSEEEIVYKQELFDLQCNFCSKSYKRKSHLSRHIEKQHKDGKVKSRRKLHHVISCKLCGEKFTSIDDYKEHKQNVSCIEEPECRFCREMFDDFPLLRDHLATFHSNGREHVCPICFKSFPTVSNRNSHIQSHNAADSVTCAECNQGFKSVLYLKKHQKAIHTKVENICSICDKKFDTQQKFDYHLKTHEAVKRYRCTYSGCDKSFQQHHHLENHKTTHTGISKFLCFKCGKEFRQECNLKAHLRIHDDHGKTYICSLDNCEKSFKTASSFRCHKKSHESNSQSNQCPECNKSFSQLSTLRVHFQTHFRDPLNRPFKCKQAGCSRSFYQERSIIYHESTVHAIGETVTRKTVRLEFVCDFCQKAFHLQSLLKRHILIHLEEEQNIRKHKCHKCEASFKRPEHLKQHINSVHLKYKPYKCEHCEKSFSQIGDRNVHKKVHIDEKLHICNVCQKAFRLAKGLRVHEKTHKTEKNTERLKTILPSHEQIKCLQHQESQVSKC